MIKRATVDTIDYGALPPRLGGNAGALPLLHWERLPHLEIYVPDWAPAARLLEMQARLEQTLKPTTMRFYRVRDVPLEDLMDEWVDLAPQSLI